MRLNVKFMVVAMIAVMALVSIALAGNSKWFDMQNCSMCKVWMEDMEMLQSMNWEQHKLTNGVFQMGSVSDEYLETYRAKSARNEKLGEKLMQGEKVYLCGSCEAMGEFIMEGANFDHFNIENGSVMILTSSDEKMVKRLHAWADKNDAEMEKMMQGGSHEGHEH